MSGLTHIDCQGLAGAWTLGISQAGFETVHRASLGKFGDEIIESNRHLIPGPWEQDTGDGADEWEPMRAALVSGTPPCSGFSLLNKSKKRNARGPGSEINNCMRELVRYAGRCIGNDGEPGPEFVSLESVQGAFKQGRGLMLELRDVLEGYTGQTYSLSHVLCSGATVGAAQMRHRYYAVWHRVPFGIDPPERRRVCTYQDAIGDLQGLQTDTWDEQAVPYRGLEQTWWLEEQGIIGEIHPQYTDSYALGDWPYYVVRDHVEPQSGRIEIVLRELEPYWPSGIGMSDAIRAYRDDRGSIPPEIEKWWDYEEDQLRGFTHEVRVRANRPGYVLTGGGVFNFIHWREPRFLTVRECARLMGYPDSWSWAVAKNIGQASNWIGKCCPVTTGRWIATWFRRALEGEPGEPLEQLDDREFVHNSTLLYKQWLREQQAEAVPA